MCLLSMPMVTFVLDIIIIFNFTHGETKKHLIILNHKKVRKHVANNWFEGSNLPGLKFD